MSLRILHVLDHSLPVHSGYTFRTASILREQRALGWDTVQLTTPKHGACPTLAEEVDGWLFHRTAYAPRWMGSLPGGTYVEQMAATARRITELCRLTRPDVIHAHSPVLNALPALVVGRRLAIPVVYEVRALWEDAAVDHGTTRERSVRYRASRAMETFALRHCSAATTICEGLRQDIARRGIPPERVAVIPNGVDTESFRFGVAPDPGLRARLGLEGAQVIGFAGSFYAYEGLDLVLEALARLAPRLPRLRLLLVGGGPQEQALQKQTERLGLAQRVIFAGRVPHAEVQRYYEQIDVLVYARHRMRLTELVTPLKPLEAMAQGRVLIASDVGGHRELIRDGETGWLFRAGDVDSLASTIETVLAGRERWDQVRHQARRFVETERTWARSVARYAEVYGRLVEPAKPGGAHMIQTGAR